ncbi:hypothetical protein VP01_2204g10 [Puccinia sorghi]|uniref:Uncharacterized protein n=1 Tax=Puccinia sorghi TaxID=27349 RepID=A0A0L6V8Z6_9BASI|nr:hypothetical protein VP01_2204g10 [Puccinia sorghi]
MLSAKPTPYTTENFDYGFCVLGPAHVMWNLAHSFFLLHFV